MGGVKLRAEHQRDEQQHHDADAAPGGWRRRVHQHPVLQLPRQRQLLRFRPGGLRLPVPSPEHISVN